jgi:hypothetical protein
MTRSHQQWPAASDPDSQRLDLSPTFVGRLVFTTGHGPRSVIVECLRGDDGFTIHLPEFNEAANYLADTAVTLTSARPESAHPPEAITGRSRLLADRDVDVSTAEALERWSDDTPAHYFYITPTRPWTRTPGQRRNDRPGRHHDPAARRDQQPSTS